MEPITSGLKKICEILDRHGVDFMLIGGHAVAFHGFTRATADIDLWFKPSTENYTRLLNALEELQIDVTELKEEVFHPENTFIRIASQGVKVEFLSTIPGKFTYREAAGASVKATINEVSIKVIGLEHLIENKSTLNRPIDRLDVEELKKRRKPEG